MLEIQSIVFCQGWQRLRLTLGFALIVWGEAKLWSSFPLSCVIYWQKWWCIFFALCLNPQQTAWQRWMTSCPVSLKFLSVLKKYSSLVLPIMSIYFLFIYLLKYEFNQKLLSLKITLICLNTLQPKSFFLSKGKRTKIEYGCHETLRTRMISFFSPQLILMFFY